MTVESASIRTVLRDVQISIRLAMKNILSFFLGAIAILIITVLFLILAIGTLVGIVILVMGPMDLNTIFTLIGQEITRGPSPAAVGMVTLLIIMSVFPFLIAVGTLFGMAREIVESADATAEGVLVWYRRKFLSFAGGGTAVFLVLFMPPVLGSLVTASSGQVGTPLNSFVFTTACVVWILLIGGLVSLVFPAIIDGHSVIDALQMSVRLVLRYFDRVYATMLAFIGLLSLLPVTAAVSNLFSLWNSDLIVQVVFGVILFVLFIVEAVIVLPAFVIAMTRLYMIFTGDSMLPDTGTTPDITLVGGD